MDEHHAKPLPGGAGNHGTRRLGDVEGAGCGLASVQDAMIRMLDHTADVGFELEAPTLEDLFDEARRALLVTMFEEPPEGGEREHVVRLWASDRETLLVRWINELVFLVQDEGFVPVLADVRIEETGGGAFSLETSLTGAPLDLEGHGWRGEVKSATFHGLDVARGGEGWQARVILDV